MGPYTYWMGCIMLMSYCCWPESISAHLSCMKQAKSPVQGRLGGARERLPVSYNASNTVNVATVVIASRKSHAASSKGSLQMQSPS